MTYNRKKIISIVAVIIFLFVAVYLGWRLSSQETSPQQSQEGTRGETAPSIPIDVNLRLSNAPRLNQTAELRCLVTSVFDASNVTVNISLPEGFVLVQGSTSWVGDIHEDGSVELMAIIKAVNVGNWTIEATAGYYLTKDSWYGDIDRLYISVSEDSAYISKTPLSMFTESRTGMLSLLGGMSS